MNAKWGAHDEFVFRKQAREISQKEQPFFSVILSLSSHEPFEVPMKPQFPGDDVPSKFKSCCYYTDKSIGEYLKSVSAESWYKNTLFISWLIMVTFFHETEIQKRRRVFTSRSFFTAMF